MAKTSPVKRLYRSESDRVLGGVAAGLAEYFEIDPVISRLLFVVAAIWGGFGFILYIVLWLIIPTESDVGGEIGKQVDKNAKEIEHKAQELGGTIRKKVDADHSRRWIGILLIVVGVWFVLGNLNIFFFRFDVLWPVIFVIAGIILLIRR